MGLYVRPLSTTSGGLYVAPLTTDGMAPSLAPTITSVGTLREGATGVAFTGTNLTGASITLDSGLYSEVQANVVIAGDGNSGTLDVVIGSLPWSSASHPVVMTVTTAEGAVEHAVTLLPPEGFGVAEMGSGVGGSTDPWSVWFECLDGEPKAGDQVVHPSLSDAGGAVSMDDTGLISIDYTGVADYETLTQDQVTGLRSWSDGVRSAPVNKTVTIEQAAIAPVVTINDYTGTDTTPALGGTIDDPAATISVNIGGADYVGVNNADGTWSLAATGELAVGSYTATVTATDADGLTGSDTASVVVEAVPVPAVSPCFDPYTVKIRRAAPPCSGESDAKGNEQLIIYNGHPAKDFIRALDSKGNPLPLKGVYRMVIEAENTKTKTETLIDSAVDTGAIEWSELGAGEEPEGEGLSRGLIQLILADKLPEAEYRSRIYIYDSNHPDGRVLVSELSATPLLLKAVD